MKCKICNGEAEVEVLYLLTGYRTNPASSAYQRDDCSRSRDASSFRCGQHKSTDIPVGYSSDLSWRILNVQRG